MDPQRVKERLLRLNEEIHDERFSGRDLGAVLGLWEEAKVNFHKSNFGIAEELIDRAYGILYAPQSQVPAAQPQPQVVSPPPQVAEPQLQAAPVIQPVEVYSVYEAGEFDKIMYRASDFSYVCFRTLVSPTKVFSIFSTAKPVSEMFVFFVLFGLLFGVFFLSIMTPTLGLDLGLIQVFTGLLLSGFFFCVLASYITHIIIHRFGGRGPYNLTAAVYGFSLIPFIICAILLLYMRFMTSSLDFVNHTFAENIRGLLLAGLILLGAAAWNVFLQSIGLSTVHKVERSKSALAAVISGVVSIFLLGLAVSAFYFSGASASL